MLVAEAHEGLSLAGHFTDRQSAFVQGFTHVQEDNGVHYVTEYLSPNGVGGPLGQLQQPEILLAGILPISNLCGSRREGCCAGYDTGRVPVQFYQEKHQHFHPTGVRHRDRPRQSYRRRNHRTQVLCWGKGIFRICRPKPARRLSRGVRAQSA